MLFEYAVEPEAIGSSWQNFRYLIEKFGFDRGRLISQFPKSWFRMVYEASASLKEVERKRLVESLNRAKHAKFIRSGRPYDPNGTWIQNAIAQHGVNPFHAIIASANPEGLASILVADDTDETNPLMDAPTTWEVERVGATLARAMGPLLRSAKEILFIDRYFDISEKRYLETLKACLDVLHANGSKGVCCEIHYGDHDSRPDAAYIEKHAPKWLAEILPDGMSIALFAWKEKSGGEDFHARYLLTDVGGLTVDSGFSADGGHQKVPLGLLGSEFVQTKLKAFARTSTLYDLVGPVLEISSDGTVRRI
jgi:hypothetical protein